MANSHIARGRIGGLRLTTNSRLVLFIIMIMIIMIIAI